MSGSHMKRRSKMLTDIPQINQALEFIKAEDDNTTQETLRMCQIAAPSFHEEKKAEYVCKRFEQIGLSDVHIDEVGNVLGTWHGTGKGPVIMLAAHTDTVFPIDTDVTVKKEGNRYYCPGINDDTHAVAEIITVAKAIVKHNIQTCGDIIFCANVCEEGLGDLKGIKHVFGKDTKIAEADGMKSGQKLHIDAFVSVDNQVTGGIIYTATGSHRYEVKFKGNGGHSFADFGLPNPIHAMGRAIAKIADFKVPDNPKTTFNVGVVNGGTSVNTISADSAFLMDIRSDSREELDRMSKQFFEAVNESVKEENARWDSDKPQVTVSIKPVGNRPAGVQDKNCEIVKAAWQAAQIVGVIPELRYESSTDANIPISMGIPAVTVGRGGMEGGMHTLHEWYEPVEAWLGPQRDMLLVLMLAGVDSYCKPVIKKA